MKSFLKYSFYTFFILLFPLNSFSAILSWESNPDQDLKGYLIYYGEKSGAYNVLIDVGNVTQYEIVDLDKMKTYYFILTAYDIWGNESVPTPEFEYVHSHLDTVPPSILKFEIIDENTIELTFSEPVDIESAGEKINYKIIPYIAINEIIIDSTQTKVTLYTETHENRKYRIIVSNILDLASVPNELDNEHIQYTMESTSIQHDIQHDKTFFLSQNYPNPFNPETTIQYSIKKPGHVQIIVYDFLGRIVKVLLDKNIEIPDYKSQVVWDGKNQNGDRVSSGRYYYQIRQNSLVITKQMTLMK